MKDGSHIANAEWSWSFDSFPGTELVLASPEIRHSCLFYPVPPQSHAAFHLLSRWLTPDSLETPARCWGWFRCIGWPRGGGEGRPLCTGELPIHDRTPPMSGCNQSTFKWLQLHGGAHLCEKGTCILCTHLCEHVPVSVPHLGSMCTSYSRL